MGASRGGSPYAARIALKLAKIIAVIACCIVFLCGGAILWAGLAIPKPFGFGLRAEFDTLPPDDEALEAWLKSCPGVSETASVEREGKSLRVVFVQCRNIAGQPPVPDLDAKCESLGYTGHNAKFQYYRAD